MEKSVPPIFFAYVVSKRLFLWAHGVRKTVDRRIYHCRADEKDGCAQKSPSSAMKNYIVSQDRKSGLWYAHMRGYQHVPVSGSFSEKRRDAAEYAKMYNGLPHKVEEIERKRREAFEKEMEKA